MTEKPKRKPGRPRVYANVEGKSGAPLLGIRFDPELYQYAHRQPQGARQYLERLVREDIERTGQTGPGSLTPTDDKPQSS